MDDDPAAIRTMQQFLPQTGVTSFLPTTMTCDWADIAAALGHVRAAMNEPPAGARVLGAHMEGPFISAEKKARRMPAIFCRPTGAVWSPMPTSCAS